MLAETYWHLVTNVPHILFELTWEAITGLLVWPVGRWFVRRHDRKHHEAAVASEGPARRQASLTPTGGGQ